MSDRGDTKYDKVHFASANSHHEEAPQRKSTRKRTVTHKVMENMEQESIDAFWIAIKSSNQTCINIESKMENYSDDDTEQQLQILRACEEGIENAYRELRERMDSKIPSEIRVASDRMFGKIRQVIGRLINYGNSMIPENRRSHDGMSVRSAQSHRSSASSTVTKRILLAARATAIQAEKEAKIIESKERSEIIRLESEELMRQANLEAKMIAERARQDAEEKIRRAQTQAELDRKKQEIEEQRLTAELQRTHAELQELNKLSFDESQMNYDE